MHAQDVIHSFWVPEWRIKKDNVPGITTTAIVTPDKLGTYQLICTELCGFGHASMRAKVVVEPPARFRQMGRRPERKSPAAADGVDQRRTPRRTRSRSSAGRGIMEAILMVAAIKRPGWTRGAARRARRRRPSASASSSSLRAISGLPAFQTEQTGYPQVVVPLITGAARLPRSASAASTTGCAGPPALPTIPDDHSQHGAKSWKDYFKLQHRSQGDRHPVHLHHLLLLLRRRPDGDADPRRARPAGHPDRRRRRPTTASSRPTRC